MTDAVSDAYSNDEPISDIVFCTVCKKLSRGYMTPCNACRRKVHTFMDTHPRTKKITSQIRMVRHKLNNLERVETKIENTLFREGVRRLKERLKTKEKP